jgi:hypothetical protein
MVIHHVEMHEVCAPTHDRAHFVAEACEISRENAGGDAKSHAFDCNRSLSVAWARAGVVALARPRPPHDAEEKCERDARFEQQK